MKQIINSLLIGWHVTLVAQPTDTSQTVSELMKFDSIRALAVSKKLDHSRLNLSASEIQYELSPNLNDSNESSTSNKHRTEVVAIYGVGKNLIAEVKSDSFMQIYKTGYKLPVLGLNNGFELYEITPTCIDLKNKDLLNRLCLEVKQP